MIEKPEDAVGKWYISLLGETKRHSFVIDYLGVEKLTGKHMYYFLEVRLKDVFANQRAFEFRFMKEPIESQYEINKLNQRLIHKIFKYGVPGWVSETMQTDYGEEADELPQTTKKNRFEKLVQAIKNNDTLAMTQIIHDIPRVALSSTLDKLKRYKYKKYPATEVAISKIKWRRSF